MKHQNIKEKEHDRFSLVQRAKSFNHASRGLWLFLKTTHNAWVQIVVFVFCIVLGFYVNLSRVDWMVLLIVSGFVFVTEAVNTAIEIDMDLTSPEYHPYAKDTKDVAAGAVLIASAFAIVIGLCIFVPYIV